MTASVESATALVRGEEESVTAPVSSRPDARRRRGDGEMRSSRFEKEEKAIGVCSRTRGEIN